MFRIRTLTLALAVIAAGCASSPVEVSMQTSLRDDLTGGTFTTDGSVLCAAGTLTNLELVTEGVDHWYAEDEWSCDDGSGSFVIRITGAGPEPKEAVGDRHSGTWEFLSGTGDYAGIDGGGDYDLIFVPFSEEYSGMASK